METSALNMHKVHVHSFILHNKEEEVEEGVEEVSILNLNKIKNPFKVITSKNLKIRMIQSLMSFVDFIRSVNVTDLAKKNMLI